MMSRAVASSRSFSQPGIQAGARVAAAGRCRGPGRDPGRGAEARVTGAAGAGPGPGRGGRGREGEHGAGPDQGRVGADGVAVGGVQGRPAAGHRQRGGDAGQGVPGADGVPGRGRAGQPQEGAGRIRAGSGPMASRLAAYRAGQPPGTASAAAMPDRVFPGWI